MHRCAFRLGFPDRQDLDDGARSRDESIGDAGSRAA
jgi:hypothetical protein